MLHGQLQSRFYSRFQTQTGPISCEQSDTWDNKATPPYLSLQIKTVYSQIILETKLPNFL